MKVFFYFDVFISLRGDYPNALLNFERGITNKDEVPLSVFNSCHHNIIIVMLFTKFF